MYKVSDLEDGESSKWWENNRKWVSSSKDVEPLPEMRTRVKAPSQVRARATAAQNRFSQGEKFVLNARSAILFDLPQTSELYKLASKLYEMGHPLLVVSRIPSTHLEELHNIPQENCKWLTESVENKNSLGSALEPLVRLVEDFINTNERAVIMLDGLEFLASVNGFVRTLDFVRDIVDYITEDDDLLIIPTDMLAWTQQERTNILRELELIDVNTLKHWLENPQEIEEHPFHAPDIIKEEIINKKINKILSKATESLNAQKINLEVEGSSGNLNIDSTNQLHLGQIAEEWADEVRIENEHIEIQQNEIVDKIEDTDKDWSPTFVTPVQESEITVTEDILVQKKVYEKGGPRRPNIIKSKKKVLPKPAMEKEALPRKKQWEEAANKSTEISGEIISDKESKRLIRQTGLANMSKNNTVKTIEEDSDPINLVIKKMSWDAAAEHAKKRGKNVR